MDLTRRDFLKASSAVGAALGLTASGVLDLQESYAKEGGLPVIWLTGSSCTGCSVSVLNSIYYATIDNLLINTLDMEYHTQLSAAAGALAVKAMEDRRKAGGYALVVEGAIPTADTGKGCYVWPGMTMLSAVKSYAANATMIIACGTCASFGGVAAAAPNPTAAKSVQAVVGTAKPLINIPGCPVHPDWIVGTIASYLSTKKLPTLDSNRRPTAYYGATVHSACGWRTQYVGPSHHSKGKPCTTCHSSNMGHIIAGVLGDSGCMYGLGCKGPLTYADCPNRRWNSGTANTPGMHWCVSAYAPCNGCTQPNFPDGMSPFYAMSGTATTNTGGTTSGTTSGGTTSGDRERDDD